VKPLTYILIGLVFGFFQGSLEVAWSLGGPAPDILLLYVVYLALQRQTVCALLVAFWGGLVQGAIDVSQPLGVQSLCKVLIAYLPEWAHYVLVSESRMTGPILVSLATVLQQILLYSLMQTFEPGGLWGLSAVWEVLGMLLWNLVIWEFVVEWFLGYHQREPIS
jgi:cell shape-determining protein MreD